MIARTRTFFLAPVDKCSQKRNYLDALIAVSLALTATSRPAIAENCASPNNGKLGTRTPHELPTGSGLVRYRSRIVVVKNAGAAQQHGVGNMVSLRAYPFGRWYAPLKSPTRTSADIVKAKLNDAQQPNDTAVQFRQQADKLAVEAADALAQAVANSTGNAVDDARKVAQQTKLANDIRPDICLAAPARIWQ
ncbi:MAG: hypothetical protein HY938_01855 [Nitrosomonadales bacterium]|nr:hypothetical protein [Nitrosomonadales bacterium]